MSTAEAVRAQQPGRPTPPAEVATPTEDLITVIFGACLIAGTFADGWAHNNILSEVQEDGFFTLWHALLYAGFTATAAWTFWLAYRRRDRAPRWWIDGWPAGYRLGALGALIFLVGGVSDMGWHTVFGVEATIDALLSPSHLVLLVGATLLLSSPMRSWWAAGDGGLRAATGVAATALATTAASVFLLYASAFGNVGPTLPYEGAEGSLGNLRAAHGLASYLITSALLLIPLLWLHRRRTTPGAVTGLVAIVAMFPIVTREFPQPQTAAALAAIAGAVVADWVLVGLDRARGMSAPLRLPIAGAVVAALLWAPHLLALHLHSGIQWPVELWTGTVASTALVGAVIGGLAARLYPYPKVAAVT
ncbi:MAG TPA: hypothetical protein VFR67_09280 [Pilimelia sp.]|nr:hypothetical protein [Pilimelia sp.]